MTIQHSVRLLPKQSQSITQIHCRRAEIKLEDDGQVLGERRPDDGTGQQQPQHRQAATAGDLQGCGAGLPSSLPSSGVKDQQLTECRESSKI